MRGTMPETPAPTVVVIDDDLLVRTIIDRKLGARGYRVMGAADGESGLALARAEQPALVILDMIMPALDGRQVLLRLRADPQLKAVPVIMLTARREEADVVDALSVGANDYIAKPFSLDELAARVARLAPLRPGTSA